MLAAMSFSASRLVHLETDAGPHPPVPQIDAYALSPRMILTAATPILHEPIIYARSALSLKRTRARVLWARVAQSPRLDAALLQLEQPIDPHSLTLFGALDFGVSAPLHHGGTLRSMRDRYEVFPKSHAEPPRPGAPLFVGELLVGIVAGEGPWACALSQIVLSGLFQRLIGTAPIHIITSREARLRFALQRCTAAERADLLTMLGEHLQDEGRAEEGRRTLHQAAGARAAVEPSPAESPETP